MNNLLQTLQGINWDFSDYTSARYPLDLNSIYTYPASMVPLIPKFLIALLTKKGDVVLDPFGGKGTTSVEAVKQGRLPVYNDLNPFASEIPEALFYAIRFCIDDIDIHKDEENKIAKHTIPMEYLRTFIIERGIDEDVFAWYHPKTLEELFAIFELMYQEKSNNQRIFQVRKLALSSILKQASSQSGHLSYIADNCKPKKLIYRNANRLYVNKMEQIVLAAQDTVKQFSLANPNDSLSDILEKARIVSGDAKKLEWIADSSINFVLTSPPYLGAQDYIKSMRLTNLFFPNQEGFQITPNYESGPRSKRHSKPELVVPNFYSDMNCAFSEIERVLVPKGFFCLVFGSGSSKLSTSVNSISDLRSYIINSHHFSEIYHVTRNIGKRFNRFSGVNNEDIIIFQKKN